MLNEQQQRAKQRAKSYFLEGPATAAAAIGGSIVSPAIQRSRNVIGIGIGAKIISGTLTEQNAVRVYVRIKIPRLHLPSGQIVPPEFNGLPTDVIEVGEIMSLQGPTTWQRRQRQRPASCGISVGHTRITAGTIGCLVEKDDTHYILSNNHILADVNNANIHDSIIQPGPIDGGTPQGDSIATLSEYKTIHLQGPVNDIDAAIAVVGNDTQNTVQREIIDIGCPSRTTTQAVLYQSVRKHGRTTGHTVGVIEDTSLDTWVNLPPVQSAWFEEQIVIRGVGNAPFAQGGDSGSLVVDAVTLRPIGLLCAVSTSGNDVIAIANPIDPILQYFQVSIVGQ
jgi:hypothetical protein